MTMQDVLKRLAALKREIESMDDEEHDDDCDCGCDLEGDTARVVEMIERVELDIEIECRREGVELVSC